ncbi:MAG: hypothetical protein JWP97_2718 [Labilithrix sp.]|nr:hypothetical protein [Labilithrix sp.]
MRSIKLSVAAVATTLVTFSATAAFADDAAMPSGTVGPTPATTTSANAPSTTTPASTTTTTSADADGTAAAASSNTYSKPEDKVIYQRHTPNKAYLITGASLFVGTYVTTAAVAANSGSIGDHDLYIPIAGPWIDLANRDMGNTSTTDKVLIIGSGVLQGVGAGMAVASFFIPEKYAAATIAMGPVKMNVSPTAGAGMGGVGAVGTF